MEVVSGSIPAPRFLHPILVHSIIEKKENTGSQMGHTKKIILKKSNYRQSSNLKLLSYFLRHNLSYRIAF